MIISVTLLLAIAALTYTLFVRAQDIPEPLPVSPIQYLEDRKQAIYDNLRDLQFEYRLGKLSDEDYQQTKQSLQRELAVVLTETEDAVARLGLTPARSAEKQVTPKRAEKSSKPVTCPHCGAQFQQNMKFCGECGKALA